MNFELLTFPYYKEMIKLTICHVSKMNPFPYRKLLYRSIKFYTSSSKSHKCIFSITLFLSRKSCFGTIFLAIFLAELNEILLWIIIE